LIVFFSHSESNKKYKKLNEKNSNWGA